MLINLTFINNAELSKEFEFEKMKGSRKWSEGIISKKIW